MKQLSAISFQSSATDKRHSQFKPTATHSFTLMEFLTVIAIIGILAGLLLPALNRIRARSRQVGCMSNLRQLGVALSFYVDDSRGVLPRSDDSTSLPSCWFYAIDPYLMNSKVSASPSLAQKRALIKQDPIWMTFSSDSLTNCRTIKMNRKLVGMNGKWNPGTQKICEANPEYRRKITIANHINTVLLFDGRCEETKSSGDKARYDGWETYAARRHLDGANVLFVDGHVEWRKETPQSDGTRTGWEKDHTTLDWWVQ